jgi:hypothetical protein
MAAPLTPHLKTKINIGSKTIFVKSPMTAVHRKNKREELVESQNFRFQVGFLSP